MGQNRWLDLNGAFRRGQKPALPALASLLCPLVLALPAPVLAKSTTDSAAENADDAFGESVGTDTVGIYTETNVRGFNPQQAGNARIEGVFFDQLVPLTFRIKSGSTIRVGQAALDFASPAPTGIVANRLYQVGDETVASLKLNALAYGGSAQELDSLIPVANDRLSVVAGVGHIRNEQIDGSRVNNFSYGFLPRIALGTFTLSAFASGFLTRTGKSRPIITTSGPFVPTIPKGGKYLGQEWAHNKTDQVTNGAILKGMLTDSLGFRGGIFQSILKRERNFTEIFAVQDEAGLARHRMLADPLQDNRAISWEGLFYYRADNEGRVRHTFLASVRKRSRHTESGGSDRFDFGTVQFGETDPEPKPNLQFDPINVGTLSQTSYSLGYFGRVKGLGQLSLGLSKSVYNARFRSTSDITQSKASPWLYNAGLRVRPFSWLALYGAYVTGLEDSGSAPENAANRNQQLPASSTEQVEGGIHIKVGQMQLVASLFQITKPNFSFDTSNRYTELGTVKHRGAEFSLAGKISDQLSILAGAVLMDPVVTGQARELGIVGERPVGVPKMHSRVDLSYRSAALNGLTFSLSMFHDSKKAVSAGLYSELGGKQLFLPPATTFDLTIRHHFKVGETPLSARFVAANLFDNKAWKVLASNALQADDQRHIMLYLTADF